MRIISPQIKLEQSFSGVNDFRTNSVIHPKLRTFLKLSTDVSDSNATCIREVPLRISPGLPDYPEVFRVSLYLERNIGIVP
jgi:hypothetical protein